MCDQLRLFGEGRSPTGRDCPFWDGEILQFPDTYFRDICTRSGTPTATICSRGVFGDQPRCAYQEPDNSDAARLRRLEWLGKNDDQS